MFSLHKSSRFFVLRNNDSEDSKHSECSINSGFTEKLRFLHYTLFLSSVNSEQSQKLPSHYDYH